MGSGTARRIRAKDTADILEQSAAPAERGGEEQSREIRTAAAKEHRATLGINSIKTRQYEDRAGLPELFKRFPFNPDRCAFQERTFGNEADIAWSDHARRQPVLM